jgi:hypothetical protein
MVGVGVRRVALLAVLSSLAAVSVLPARGAAPGGPDLYRASLAYVKCMRAHGVPQPDPDRTGNIHLTPTDERRMRQVGHANVNAADAVCFDRYLKGVVDTKPLSAQAKTRAIAVLEELSVCMRTHGYRMGRPVIQNLSRGRAFFGFESAPTGGSPAERKHRAGAQHKCEQRVQLAKKIDEIVKADRSPT